VGIRVSGPAYVQWMRVRNKAGVTQRRVEPEET
jgi:hypothetical protein